MDGIERPGDLCQKEQGGAAPGWENLNAGGPQPSGQPPQQYRQPGQPQQPGQFQPQQPAQPAPPDPTQDARERNRQALGCMIALVAVPGLLLLILLFCGVFAGAGGEKPAGSSMAAAVEKDPVALVQAREYRQAKDAYDHMPYGDERDEMKETLKVELEASVRTLLTEMAKSGDCCFTDAELEGFTAALHLAQDLGMADSGFTSEGLRLLNQAEELKEDFAVFELLRIMDEHLTENPFHRPDTSGLSNLDYLKTMQETFESDVRIIQELLDLTGHLTSNRTVSLYRSVLTSMVGTEEELAELFGSRVELSENGQEGEVGTEENLARVEMLIDQSNEEWRQIQEMDEELQELDEKRIAYIQKLRNFLQNPPEKP